ncbi:MAG: cobalt-precorrin-6A reductase [Rhodospirillales bacterium]|nr:cobalt-precorrin-6A reductase [Rhodospirillales bacterium]
MSTPRVLVLGGTQEARVLADALVAGGIDAILSLAGRTSAPAASAARARSGGFGGAEGLAAYLRAESIAACIDATHPFAARMSANTVAACTAAGVPRLAVLRPEWTPVDGDRWIFVDDAAKAARLLPAMGRRIFVAFADGLAPFAALDLDFLVRRAEPGPAEGLPGAEVLVQRGPFARDAERALFAARKIDAIVAKASGGDGARAKLDAARNLGLPVVLLRRPTPPPGPYAGGTNEALGWVRATLGLDPGAPSSI